jgi:hypothetical protein
MLPLAHLGFGLRLSRPFGRLPLRWLIAGCLLPDLIDKPLYYGLSAWTGLRGAELGLISCTRTFGHTGLFIGVLLSLALALRGHPGRTGKVAALAVGMTTHLFLDAVSEKLAPLHGRSAFRESSTLLALTFPYYGRFGIQPFESAREHFLAHLKGFTLATEILGAIFLSWELWTRDRSREILLEWRRRFRNVRDRRRDDPRQPRPR